MQLFDTRDSLADAVAAYLEEGLVEGEWALVVATYPHWQRIEAELHARGLDVARLEAAGIITAIDADSLLQRFVRRGAPDPAAFATTVGAAVKRLSRASGGRLRVYGEMVEVLAGEGNYAAAVQLERLWNGLAAECAFRLLCGYSAAHFADPLAGTALAEICGCHARATARDRDALGEFLLARHERELPAAGTA